MCLVFLNCRTAYCVNSLKLYSVLLAVCRLCPIACEHAAVYKQLLISKAHDKVNDVHSASLLFLVVILAW
jgi:hypothetical protein